MSIAENVKMSQGLQSPAEGGAFDAPSYNVASGILDAEAHDGHESSAVNNLSDEQLVALHEVTKTISREGHLQRALAVIADKARQLTSGTSTALALLDEDRQLLDFIAVAGRGASEMIGQRVRVSDALPGQTAVTGEPLLAFSPSQSNAQPEAAQDFLPSEILSGEAAQISESGETLSSAPHDGVRSAAVVPIFLDGRSIGSLASINKQDGESFGGSDLLILHILASAAASILQADALRKKNVQTERERDVLFEAARRTSSTLNVQQILNGVMSTISKSIDSFAEIIFLLNDDRTHLFIASARGLTEEELEIQLLAEDQLASAAFAGNGGTPFVISNGASDPRYEVILPEERVKPATLLVAPLVSRDNPMGLLVVFSHHPNAYSKADLRLVSAVAAQAAVEVENAWLYEDATRRAEEATAIYELSQSVNTNLNLQRVLNFVADSVIALLQVDKFALFLHNPRTETLEIKVGRNLRKELSREMRCTADRGGIAWWVYQFETPTAIQNVAADNRNRSCPIDQENVASLVSVPLQAGDEVIGVIHAMSSRPRLFTVAEMELLYTIANQVGVAVRNTQTLEHMRQKSVDLRRASRLVSKALGTSLDSPGAAQTIADLASEILGADRCLLYSIEHGAIRLAAAHGIRPSNNMELNDQGNDLVGYRETSAAWIARKGKTLILAKDSLESRLVLAKEYSSLAKSGAYIGIPLKVGSEVIGVLEAFTRDARTISSDDIRHIKAFGGQAAIALQNAMLVQKATRRRTDLQMLSALASDLAKSPLSKELIHSSLGRLSGAVLANHAVLEFGGEKYEWGSSVTSELEIDDQHKVEVLLELGGSAADQSGHLTVTRDHNAQPFEEPDRYLTQTVADFLVATLQSKSKTL